MRRIIIKRHRAIQRPKARFFNFLWVLALVWICLTASGLLADTKERKSFDHLAQTGYELSPVHRLADCADCHIHNIFEGTPRACRGCHGSQGIRGASRKGARHIRSTDNCELCHMDFIANSWSPIRRVDHLEVRGSCFSCHNGVVATPKNARHIPSSNRCEDCHRTRSWDFSPFNHNVLPASGAGTCYSCHNSVFATGKIARHIPSGKQCDDCHIVNNFLVSRFNHNVLAGGGSGQCGQCHGPGRFAKNTKPPSSSHIRNSGIESGNACDACHIGVATFTLQRIDHSQLANDGVTSVVGNPSARCNFCHQQDKPPPIPGGHRFPSNDCAKSGCHRSTSDWCNTGFLSFLFPAICN